MREVIIHLKKRFVPGKDNDYYVKKLNNIRMCQEETVLDFYDKLRILMSAAESNLKEDMAGTQKNAASLHSPIPTSRKALRGHDRKF